MERYLDAETLFDNPSTTESKRSHQWFTDAAEQELFPNKKQAVEAPNSKSISGVPTGSLPWDATSGFQSVPNQFIDRLFRSETTKPVSFSERYISGTDTESSNMRKKAIEEHFGNHSSVGLSMSYGIEDPNTCLSYGGIRKIKVNQVKESDSGLVASMEHNRTCSDQIYNRMNETSFISMGQAYGKEDDSISSMGHAYKAEADIRSTVSLFGTGNSIEPIDHSYIKEHSNNISFEGFNEESNSLARPTNSYNMLYNQSSVQTSETPIEKELAAANVHAVVIPPQVAKPKPQVVTKNKSDSKPARKEAPNSFPSNVRSLIATGMLDGVPVKYVALSREELRGIIKGSGYLCGCQSCNYSKALNAYEFERHAGCKTKHPNNHIYFENGKTIYQIVQELRSTSETLLFDAIQTVTGSPINQKAFRVWKESFQAATRELQRIYGKEELNL